MNQRPHLMQTVSVQEHCFIVGAWAGGGRGAYICPLWTRRKGQPSSSIITEGGADTNLGRTVPNRHRRSGDRPAPNKIEFEGWFMVSASSLAVPVSSQWLAVERPEACQ